MLQPVSEAVGDLRAAWRGRRIAMAFAHEDVADAYRKTSLGPIWMLISYLLFNCAIVFVAGHPADIPNYIGFVACGLLVFQFMSEVISDGVTLFHREQPYIKGTTLPISIYVFRLTCRSMLRNAYPLAGAVGLLLYSGEIPNVAWLYAIAGIVLIILATPAVVTVAAIIGALSPDMGFVVQNVLRLSFFLSPVFWDKTEDPIRKIFYHLNPFTYFISIVRTPIIKGYPDAFAWLVAIAITLVFWLIAILLLGRFRNRIVFLV
jgi:ABC-type polysaccharide/polyol phosphate export permease